MGPLISVYKLRGEQQERMGSSLPYTVPRGVFQCSDDLWVGISTSSETVAKRVMILLGLGDDVRFSSFVGRTQNRVVLENAMTAWCQARTQKEVLQEMNAAQAAVGPVLSMADIAQDPHYSARDAIISVDGTPMQGLVARLSATPGEVKWHGKELDADGAEIRRNGWGKHVSGDNE